MGMDHRVLKVADGEEICEGEALAASEQTGTRRRLKLPEMGETTIHCSGEIIEGEGSVVRIVESPG